MSENFNWKEIQIIKVLRLNINIYFTTNNIAKKSNMSWNTAKKTLEILFDKGYIERGKMDKKSTHIYWRLPL